MQVDRDTMDMLTQIGMDKLHGLTVAAVSAAQVQACEGYSGCTLYVPSSIAGWASAIQATV